MDMQQPQQFSTSSALHQELNNQYNRATATSADDVDLLAINLFATMVQQNEASISLDASRIIARKFQSKNADEVLLALNVLEECMSKCGRKFHNEIGKFRFLNELIRLVSPQYAGATTSKKIKDKILDLLLLWTHTYPHETKIKEAYDMLLKRGVKHEHVKGVVVPNANGANGNGAEANETKRDQAEPELAARLKGLLHSSRPADIQAANLLIQNMVKESERRHEVQMRRKLELKEIMNNASLLKDMLDECEQNGAGSQPTEDELTTMQFLYDACKRLQPTILIILNDVAETECLSDAVDANEFLIQVFQSYHRVTVNRQPCADLITPMAATTNGRARPTTMDELSEIFASGGGQTSPVSHAANMTPLAPTPASPAPESNGFTDKLLETLLAPEPVATNDASNSTPFDSISRAINMDVASTSKPSLVPPSAALATSAAKANAVKTKFENFDSQLSELITGLKSNLAKEAESPLDDDTLMLLSDADTYVQPQMPTEPSIVSPAEVPPCADPVIDPGVKPAADKAVAESATCSGNGHGPIKRLTDIVIDLNAIQPHAVHSPRCILDDKSGLKIVLNFARDRPMDAVAVLVITTTNQSSLPVTNVQFEASVSKPCKLHLQKASGNQLAGIKPFRPATDDIFQILLISNAERRPIKLVCILSYNLGDDPDPVKEFIEVSDLPDLFS